MLLTRCYGFSAAHKLWNPDWDVSQNEKAFGDCARLHGHTYRLEVTVSGEANSETGMIIDLRELDALVNELILCHVDHRYLDEEVDFIQGQRSTVEILSKVFFDRLVSGFDEYKSAQLLRSPHSRFAPHSAQLHRVRLYESSDNWAETVSGV